MNVVVKTPEQPSLTPAEFARRAKLMEAKVELETKIREAQAELEFIQAHGLEPEKPTAPRPTTPH